MVDVSTPETGDDKQAARAALARARELLKAGTNEKDAAKFSCVNCPEWSGLVLAILEGRASVWHTVSTPEEAAKLTRRTYGTRAKDQCVRRADRSDNDADAAFWREVASLL